MIRIAIALLALIHAGAISTAHAAETATTFVAAGVLNHPKVTKIEFSPSGKFCVTAGGEKIKLWDTETWELLAEVEAHRIHRDSGEEFVSVRGMQFLPDEKTLITAGDDGNLCYWTLPTMERRAIFGEPWVYEAGPLTMEVSIAFRRVPVGALALTPDGQTLVASRFKTLQCVDVSTQKVVRQFGSSPQLEPWSLDDYIPAEKPDRAKYRALTLQKVFDFEREPTSMQQLKSARASISNLQFSPDGRYLSADDEVYDFVTGKQLMDLSVRAWSPDGQMMLTWNGGRPTVCKFPRGEVVHQFDIRVGAAGFFDNSTVYLCQGAFVTLFNLQSRHAQWRSPEDQASSSIRALATSSQGVLAVAWSDWDRGYAYLYRAAK